MYTKEAAEVLGIKVSKIYEIVDTLELKPCRLPNQRFRFDLGANHMELLSRFLFEEVRHRQALEKLKRQAEELNLAKESVIK